MMQLFDINQGDKRLVLSRRPLSQRTGLLYGLGVLVFLGWCFWLSLQESMNFASSITILCIVFMLIYACFQIVPSLLDIVRGGAWVIDLQKETVEHNGKVVAELRQIYSVRVWEEDHGEGSTLRLALQPAGSKPLVISQAFNETEWEELKAVAQRISAFTSIKLVHQ